MKPSATIRTQPADFFVEEVPMYAPAGNGSHVFVCVRKTGWSTPACIRTMARALNVDPDAFGHAGMKDRHAVTVQTLSFPWPEQQPLPCPSDFDTEGIEVLYLERNPQKLRVGHLIGNRFVIVLRDVMGPADDIREALEVVRRQGVPNAYGPQRFGRDGDNPQRTLSWLRGEIRGPRDRRTQKLMLSSVQSMLFDRLLAKRVAEGTWNTVVVGDLVKTVDRGGLFLTEDAEVDAKRALAGEVSATGPIFGPRMRWPQGEPAQWEREVLEEALGGEQALQGMEKVGAGSRRSLRILPKDLEFEFSKTGASTSLEVRMMLPKGAYATTALGSVFQLRDASIPSGVASKQGTVTDSSPHDELLGDIKPSSR